MSSDGWFRIVESPQIQNIWEQHLRRPCVDGIAYGDGLVDANLVGRLRADVKRLIDEEPVDYHPGSGTKVRDLVHPSLYPYIEGENRWWLAVFPKRNRRPMIGLVVRLNRRAIGGSRLRLR